MKGPWRIAVDTGGTFTDLVVADADGRLVPVKSPSVPSDPAEGVMGAVRLAAERLGFTERALLEGCRQFIHGSTIATNTILEGKGAKVGLLATLGFRDALEIRRGLRANPWDHRTPYAPVLVPRSLRLGVPGRIATDGSVIEPLDREAAGAAIMALRQKGAETLAIALLNSFANPAHEDELAAIAADVWPGVWISRSASVAPLIGEYERTSTAVVDAAVALRIVPYLTRLADRLAAGGLASRLLLMQSNGGMLTVDQVRARPVALVLSGPAAGVGALEFFAAAHGASSDMITMEIGGTSCDVILMSAGKVGTTDQVDVAGYDVLTPSVEIHTVSAGGGTIARVDEGGLLEAGPEGAGANPGPACYGRGGTRPTITDSQLALGRLKPGPYAGGVVSLDAGLADAAIAEHVGTPLGLPVVDAAAGIVEVMEQHLLHAVERISIERGHDPGRFILVAVGGAGPMHGASVARKLGCRGVYIPRLAGVFCAIGMLNSDVRHDFARTAMTRLAPGSLAALEPAWSDLRRAAGQVLDEEGFGPDRQRFRYELDLRHPGQQWPLPVEIDRAAGEAEARERFEADYERLYGHRQPGSTVEIVTCRLVATGLADRLPVLRSPLSPEPLPSPGTRPVVLGRNQPARAIAIYGGDTLRPGHVVPGPAIVEELTTTILVGPNDVLRVDAADNFVIDFTDRARHPMDIDAIQLALVQKQLDHISQQMGWVMMRTARSAIFSVSHDFSCFLGDRSGRIIAQADGIPIHTGGGGYAMQAVIARYGEGIAPGDVYILNDPYVAGGNHLPDYTIIRPVFLGGERIGFVCNRGHQSDIGGGAAGTYNPAATEIFHEGLRIPVMRLLQDEIVNDDLWRLLLLNTRCPELMDGDLRAMIGSTRIGAERLAGIGAALGQESCSAYFDAVLDHGERRMRAAVATLPFGTYSAEDVSDTDCFTSRDVAIRVTLTVSEDGLVFDFTGTDPQILGFKNSSFQNTASAVYLALSTFFPFDIPRNEGTYRSVRIVAPPGTVVNARAPAPMTMCTVFPAHDIINACWRALALADPERGCGSWGKSSICNTSGAQEGQEGSESSEPFILYQWHGFPGAGAVRERDGFNQIGQMTTLGGMMLPNVESWERIYPVRIRRCEFRTDGGGPGATRGGTGVDYEADMLVPAEYAFRGEGARKPTGLGVSGGGNGASGRMTIRLSDCETEEAPQYAVRRLPPLTLHILSPGGGGFGAPTQRRPEDVRRDVEDGVVSPGVAREVYRVAIDPATFVIDRAETAMLRAPTAA